MCHRVRVVCAVASEAHAELHGGRSAGLECAPWARAAAARGGPQCCALRSPAAALARQAARDAAGDRGHPPPGARAPGASPPGCQRTPTSSPPACASLSTTQDGRPWLPVRLACAPPTLGYMLLQRTARGGWSPRTATHACCARARRHRRGGPVLLTGCIGGGRAGPDRGDPGACGGAAVQ